MCRFAIINSKTNSNENDSYRRSYEIICIEHKIFHSKTHHIFGTDKWNELEDAFNALPSTLKRKKNSSTLFAQLTDFGNANATSTKSDLGVH